MKVRRLTKAGVQLFSSYVNDISTGQQQNAPSYLLEDSDYSEVTTLNAEVSDRSFGSRYEMGEFLVELFDGQNMQPYLGDCGFWSWFALLWFEQLCPRKGGVLNPSKLYNYVLSEKYNHRPRHAIYMSWQLVDRYGDDARFLLAKEMSTRGEITEQLMARQEILSSDGVMRLASKLYFDSTTNGFKRGAASRTGAGCVTRYLGWLDQVKLNYDAYNMSASDLKAILPQEFERFLNEDGSPVKKSPVKQSSVKQSQVDKSEMDKDFEDLVCQKCRVTNRIPSEYEHGLQPVCGKCESPLF